MKQKIKLQYYTKLSIFIICGFFVIFLINNGLFDKLNNKLKLFEPFENTDDLIMNKSDAFCGEHGVDGLVLDQKCGSLTNKNCNATSCCVWNATDDKCVAGNENGPTFNTDSNGKTLPTDYYYKNVFYKNSE